MQNKTWVSVAVFPDRVCAEAVLQLLANAAVPAYLASNEHVPGLGTRFSVFVPSDLLHRAQWISQESPVSDTELTYLATGELPENDDR